MHALSIYGVCISQLIQYSRACGFYRDFLDRGLLLTRKLLNQVIISKDLWSPPLLGYHVCRKGLLYTFLHCLFQDEGQDKKQTFDY
jgi:hypothetical protein